MAYDLEFIKLRGSQEAEAVSLQLEMIEDRCACVLAHLLLGAHSMSGEDNSVDFPFREQNQG